MKPSVSESCDNNHVCTLFMFRLNEVFLEKVCGIIGCVIYLFLISKQRNERDTMAPHPVVQAIIDLSAGAVGKLQYLHF